MQEPYGFPYAVEPVMSYRATLSEPEVVGPLAEGFRMNLYVTGGEVFGQKLNGEILPVGGDWLTLRTDGVGVLDVRATLKTSDDALIYTHYEGLTDLGSDGYQKFVDGEFPLDEALNLRARPVYRSAHPDYAWVNRAFLIGIGKAYLAKGEVRYDVYQVM